MTEIITRNQVQIQKPKLMVKSTTNTPLDIFSISDILKQYLALGINELNNSGFERGSKNDNNDIDDPLLDQYIKDLTAHSEKIAKKFIKGLGQMYKGVLIKDQVSVRPDGKVYRYRCQWALPYDNLCGLLLNQRQEVIKNMGTDKGEKLFQVIDKIYPNGQTGQDALIVNTDNAKGVVPITPFNIFDFSTDGYYRGDGAFIPKGVLLTISELEFNNGSVTFKTENGKELDNVVAHKICVAKHKHIIDSIRNDIIQSLEIKKNELKAIEQIIDDNIGKYILVAELS